MATFFTRFKKIFLLLIFLLSLYLMTRLVFLLYNHHLFTGLSFKDIVFIFSWGWKMDLSAIVWLNIPVFILIFAAQYPFLKNRILLSAAALLFIVLNIAGLALNVIDIGYFSFTRHRSNTDLLYVFSDSMSSFWSILTGYWILIIFFLLMACAVVVFAKRVLLLRSVLRASPALAFSQCLMIALLLLFARGWQARPLIPSSPLLQLDAPQLPLAQNSINTFLYSLARRQQQLKPKKYFTRNELDRIVASHRVCKPQTGTDSLIKKNVIICILESFSRCYLMPGDVHKASTPFFDSLIRKSTFFPNAFANAFESNQGIVAILGGLPAFLDEPFYYSAYANTPLKSIGNILKENGYNTNFFMGAGKDHFGFGKFTRLAGIDNYYSQADFNDDRFYDGNWGIFDEPFLQYGSQVLAKKEQPFLAVFFNISSHSPYTIPDIYRRQFDIPGQSPAQRSISYVDYAFRRFFEAAKQSSWFRHTLFVFCADHYYYPGSGSYDAVTGSTIPIFIYDPSADTGRTDARIISQIDITPTILNLLNYTGTYTGFGTNVFDSTMHERYAINKPGHIFQVITKDFVLGYDASSEKTEYLYHYPVDSLLKNNLLDNARYRDTANALERIVKANIQCYNQALIRRSLE